MASKEEILQELAELDQLSAALEQRRYRLKAKLDKVQPSQSNGKLSPEQAHALITSFRKTAFKK